MTEEEKKEVRKTVVYFFIAFLDLFERVARSEKEEHGLTLPDKLAALREGYTKTYRQQFGEEPVLWPEGDFEWPEFIDPE